MLEHAGCRGLAGAPPRSGQLAHSRTRRLSRPLCRARPGWRFSRARRRAERGKTPASVAHRSPASRRHGSLETQGRVRAARHAVRRWRTACPFTACRSACRRPAEVLARERPGRRRVFGPARPARRCRAVRRLIASGHDPKLAASDYPPSIGACSLAAWRGRAGRPIPASRSGDRSRRACSSPISSSSAASTRASGPGRERRARGSAGRWR